MPYKQGADISIGLVFMFFVEFFGIRGGGAYAPRGSPIYLPLAEIKPD